MTDVRTAARAKVREEDREGIEARIQTAAAEMQEDVKRARAREAVHKQRVALLAAHEETKQAILEACGGSMVAVRTFVAKLREMFVLYATLRDQTKDLRGHISAEWSPFQIIARYGFRLGAELSKISGIANALGSLRWSLHGAYPAGADWIEAEKKILAMKDVNNAKSNARTD